jgi:hypothetical protein
VWHVAWTRGQNDPPLQIGCTKPKDLVQWSAAGIDVMTGEPTACNAWAPESVWNAARREWLIFWAATVPGRFADTDSSGGSGYNHRDGTVVKISEAQAKALQAR